MKASSEAYLASNPELRALLKDFVEAVLREQPDDVRGFATDFFAQYEPEEEDKGLVKPDTGIGEVTL